MGSGNRFYGVADDCPPACPPARPARQPVCRPAGWLAWAELGCQLLKYLIVEVFRCASQCLKLSATWAVGGGREGVTVAGSVLEEMGGGGSGTAAIQEHQKTKP